MIFAYDLDGRLSTLSFPANDIALSYAAAGRIIGMSETNLPAKSFLYNKVGRLYSYTSGATSQSISYGLVGNRLTFNQTGASRSRSVILTIRRAIGCCRSAAAGANPSPTTPPATC